MSCMKRKKEEKIKYTKIKYTIGFIILAITLYFISINEFRPDKLACIKNPPISDETFLYKGKLYFKIPNKILNLINLKKFGIKNLYCEYI